MSLLLFGILATAGWIIFDLIATYVTYPELSRGWWWALAIFGAILVVCTIVERILEATSQNRLENKRDYQLGAIASATEEVYRRLAAITSSKISVEPIEILNAAVKKIETLETEVAEVRHERESRWQRLTDQERVDFLATLREYFFTDHSPLIYIIRHSSFAASVELADMLQELFSQANWQAGIYLRNSFGPGLEQPETAIVIKANPKSSERYILALALGKVGISYRMEEADIPALATGVLAMYLLIGKRRQP
jgi:hypothetical protein